MVDSELGVQTASQLPSPSHLFKSSWLAYSKSWKLYTTLVVLPLLVTLVILGVTAAIIGTILSVSGGDFTPGRIAMMTPPGLVALGALIYVNVIAQIGMIKAVQLNGETTIRELLKSSKSLVWPFTLLSLLVGVTVLVGAVLLIIPALIFTIWYMFSSYVLVTEGLKGQAAMKQSRQYVKGKFWAVAGRVSLLMLVIIVFSSVLTSFDNQYLTGLTQLITSLVLNPIAIIYSFKLYQGAKASNV